ncbi:MAG: transglycosylase domain-containing protein, partial [Chloroflexota bacterium]
ARVAGAWRSPRGRPVGVEHHQRAAGRHAPATHPLRKWRNSSLAAFNTGGSPATVVDDGQTTFPGYPPYTPKNYDGAFRGKVTVRAALANSYNIPAVKALQHVGVPALFDLGRRTGITSFADASRHGLAATLGGSEVRLLDLTGAYGVLANGGRRVAPVSILKIAEAGGNVLEQIAGPRATPVVDAARAYMVTSILLDNEARTPAFGPNSPLKLSRPAAVKTGTTDDFKDNWTLGYTGQLVTGVWVGNADNTAMRGTTGLSGAAPIWHDFMEYALAPLPVDPMDPPPGLTKVTVGRESGKLWIEGCPEAKIEDFVLTGQAPRERCAKPTPSPTATVDPLSTTTALMAARTPRATSTPLPSVETLRERAVMTATAAAGYAQTVVAERRATMTATPFPRARTEVEVAGVQITRTTNSPAAQRSPTPTTNVRR